MEKQTGIIWGTPDNAEVVERVFVELLNEFNESDEHPERAEGIRFSSGWILFLHDGYSHIRNNGQYVGQENGTPVYLLDDLNGNCEDFRGNLNELIAAV